LPLKPTKRREYKLQTESVNNTTRHNIKPITKARSAVERSRPGLNLFFKSFGLVEGF